MKQALDKFQGATFNMETLSSAIGTQEESVTSFQPNRLVLESGQKLIVETFSQFSPYRIVLRPSRKRLFANEPEVPSLSVELSKPAFAALVSKSDPDAKPILVFETDMISAGIRELYRGADICYAEVEHAGSRKSIRFEKRGLSAKIQFDLRNANMVAETLIGWSETVPRENRGSLVRNECEKIASDAIEGFAEDLGVCIHHHVPFGYAAGYRSDLPRAIARYPVEMTLSLKPELDPFATVVLPIRIDAGAPAWESNGEDEDQSLVDFVCNVQMPMAAIQQEGDSQLRITYSLDGFDEVILDKSDSFGWTETLRKIAEHSLRQLGLRSEE